MAVPVVPEQPPDQGEIHVQDMVNPYYSIWWTSETVSGVDDTVMGWLVAQGWDITAVTQDNSTTPPTLYYALAKQAMDTQRVLLDLCNSFTVAWNDAKFANELRYNQVVRDWTQTLEAAHDQLEQQVDHQNAQLGVYITDLNRYMDEINVLIEENRDDLALDYSVHKDATEALLTGLGTTELSRINEAFASSLSIQIQDLITTGLYTSDVRTDKTAKNTRDKNEAIAELNDRLNREKLTNKHTLYGQNVSLSEFKNAAIAAKMNAYVTRLDGWKSVHADDMKLMAYQLDTQNNLLIGLYSFVERREDVAPDWRDLSTMIAGLGDSAGGWLTPS